LACMDLSHLLSVGPSLVLLPQTLTSELLQG